jgi:hypothetical protein
MLNTIRNMKRYRCRHQFSICYISENGKMNHLAENIYVQGGLNMTGTNCDLFTHK